MTISTGEAVINLLARYGVDTIFGIPGVHTLEFCNGLAEGAAIEHIQARNEMGAGFMADGYARSTGKPGVCLTISGPGVTNATTALGQSYADSIPLLLISAEASSETLGKGWGVLHEVTDLNAVTAPLTAFSACARTPQDIPELLGQAFSIFASTRPRPVHISIPVDILAMHVEDNWKPVSPPSRPQPDPLAISDAAKTLSEANKTIIIAGGGAVEADITALVERLGAIAVTSYAGKGIVPESHPLSLRGGICRPEVHALLGQMDCILAIGTELSETDAFTDRFNFDCPLIRIDIDPRKMNDNYPATIGIVSDAKPAVTALLEALGEGRPNTDNPNTVAKILDDIPQTFGTSEQKHARLLEVIRGALTEDAIVMGDSCQISYTAPTTFTVEQPRRWHYAAGFCALGFAFPNAIGAKLAQPETPVLAIAGDGGSMFTIQELITGAELKLPIPLILWHNNGYKQIRDDMRAGNYPRVGVDGLAPDFITLAKSMHCHATEPQSAEELARAIKDALEAGAPTLILVHEESEWLAEAL